MITYEISQTNVVIGSLLRVCKETYKQSNRNDNKTNNKDTQLRFEQEAHQRATNHETSPHLHMLDTH